MTFRCRLESSIKSYECFMFLLNFRLKISAPPPPNHTREGIVKIKGGGGIPAGVFTLFSVFSPFSLFSLYEGQRVFWKNSLLIFSVLTHLWKGGGSGLLSFLLYFQLFSLFLLTGWEWEGSDSLVVFNVFTLGVGEGQIILKITLFSLMS